MVFYSVMTLSLGGGYGTSYVSGEPPLYNGDSLNTTPEMQENPEGYYAFIESSKMEPPSVRPPPYFKSNRLCPGKLLLV